MRSRFIAFQTITINPLSLMASFASSRARRRTRSFTMYKEHGCRRHDDQATAQAQRHGFFWPAHEKTQAKDRAVIHVAHDVPRPLPVPYSACATRGRLVNERKKSGPAA